jgi:exonuclease-1
MDRSGRGYEIDLDELENVSDYDFKNFKGDTFLTLCILSGCDYLESIKGIGFKKAFKLIHEFGDDISAILKKMRREGKYIIPLDYEKNFERAMLTFKF